MKNNLQKNFVNILFLIGSVLFLMLPALQNGYPLFYSDSASYIVSGHVGAVPIDRPILYGLFVRHISMSFSLWLVVFVQAILFVGLTWASIKSIKLSGKAMLYTFIICSLTGLFTGASNYISQIMPDIFSAYMIWAIALIFITDHSKLRWGLWVLALFSSMVHFSNLLSITILVGLSIVVTLFFRRKISYFTSLMIQLSGLLILPWIMLPIVNYAYQKEFFINKSSNIFFTGRLIETEILQQYFEKYPESSQYSLFSHSGHLPEKTWQFAWNADSPLYEGDCIKSGWGTCWLVKSDEYGRMIYSVLSKPDLLVDFFKVSMKDWKNQIVDFELGPLNQLGESSGFKEITAEYFDDSSMFIKSNQFKGNLTFEKESSIHHLFVISAIVVLLIVLFVLWRFKFDKTLLIVLIVIIAGLLVNALVCSIFSGVLNRYQGRVIWLIPMISILFLCHLSGVVQTKKE